MSPDEREELFEQAVRLSADRRTWSDADRLWTRVVSAYEAAIRTSPKADRNDERQLARALWRHASLLTMLARADEAVASGRQAVTWFKQIHDAVTADGTTQRRDEALGTLLTAMADLAGFEFNAGRPAARLDILRQAAELGIAEVANPLTAEPHTKRAMGFVYHHFAAALLEGDHDRDDVVQASLMASMAVEIRQSELDATNPSSAWELASTYVVFARCLVAMDDRPRLDMLVPLAENLMDHLGPSAAALRAELHATVAPSQIPKLPDIIPKRLSTQPPPRRRWWQR
ncbi:hypothetical protein [Actinomadura livida]|uniref:Tetratricopeptide repeat protein n=1 Tax=Actinomadura livida TaxID=79909 RepID=A0A7W7I8B1_9ACTN|nr:MULTISPECIES: hypothetical protein [Actinomadura]MBB4772361.1 hypothetical protein [Actinomadura catellatispora]GGU23500.1 hypothetical protein GCM10010208_55730 [Actinomadura livida]